eukprot:g32131.t1
MPGPSPCSKAAPAPLPLAPATFSHCPLTLSLCLLSQCYQLLVMKPCLAKLEDGSRNLKDSRVYFCETKNSSAYC